MDGQEVAADISMYNEHMGKIPQPLTVIYSKIITLMQNCYVQ